MEGWIRLAQFGFQVVCALLGGAAFVMTWMDRKERASKKALSDLERKVQVRLNEHESTQDSNHQINQQALAALRERMAALDETLKHMPTNSDINNLAQSVSALASRVSELKGEVSGTTRTVERMNQFLMERGS